MNDDRKFGTCPVCRKGNLWLYFVMGSLKGQPWGGFICQKCYEELRGKRKREVDE